MRKNEHYQLYQIYQIHFNITFLFNHFSNKFNHLEVFNFVILKHKLFINSQYESITTMKREFAWGNNIEYNVHRRYAELLDRLWEEQTNRFQLVESQVHLTEQKSVHLELNFHGVIDITFQVKISTAPETNKYSKQTS